jgi:hypothetical protein
MMTTDYGRSPDGSGYSAEPEPSCTVSAVPVSIPNAIDLMADRIGADRLADFAMRLEQAGASLAYSSDINGWNSAAQNRADGLAVIQLFESAAMFRAASAIKARRAETPKSGSVEDESAVPQGDAQGEPR